MNPWKSLSGTLHALFYTNDLVMWLSVIAWLVAINDKIEKRPSPEGRATQG